jgi:hypothetical protein
MLTGWTWWPTALSGLPGSGAVAVTGISLRRNCLEVSWLLRRGTNPGTLEDVFLHTDAKAWPCAISLGLPGPNGEPTGHFSVPVPAEGPPWRLQGGSRSEKWGVVIRADPFVVGDYRQSTAGATDAAQEHAGVTFGIERLCLQSDRLAVFCTISVQMGESLSPKPPRVWLQCSERVKMTPIIPLGITGGAKSEVAGPAVVYFPGQKPGANVELRVPSVLVNGDMRTRISLRVPGRFPGFYEPYLLLPTGHMLKRIAFTEEDTVLHIMSGITHGPVHVATLLTDTGEAVQGGESMSSPDETVTRFDAVPKAARRVVIARLRYRRTALGPWHIGFRVPHPHSGHAL